MGLDDRFDELPAGDERLVERVRALEQTIEHLRAAQQKTAAGEFSDYYGRYVRVRLRDECAGDTSYAAYVGRLEGESEQLLYLSNLHSEKREDEAHNHIAHHAALPKSAVLFVRESIAPNPKPLKPTPPPSPVPPAPARKWYWPFGRKQ